MHPIGTGSLNGAQNRLRSRYVYREAAHVLHDEFCHIFITLPAKAFAMEDKYNQLSIEQYSRNLARILSDRYFAANQTINGQQLITFSPVKQINLFIIKELLISWNKEMANLKSPYFDFEDQDVKDALKQFMNVLSRKILIKRPHFEPLLQKAIRDTFKLVLDPVSSLEEKFLNVQENPS